MEQDNIKKDIVSKFLEKQVLVSPDFLENIEKNFNVENLYSLLSDRVSISKFLILTDEIKKLLKDLPDDINWFEFENVRVEYEKEKKND